MLRKSLKTQTLHTKKNASSPDLVAQVVLNAIRDENPSLRYLAGSDVETWLGGRRKIADEELYNMMKQNLKIEH